MQPRKGAYCAALWFPSIALLGCGPSYDHLDFRYQTTPPQKAVASGHSVEIAPGQAIGFTTVAMTNDEPLEGDHSIDLQSGDPNILGVKPGTSKNTFILYGSAAGTTRIVVTVDGKRENDIPATVRSP